MTETLVIALLSALAVSAVSFIGATTLMFSGTRFKKLTNLLLALAAGAMLGNALLHMLPHAMEHSAEVSAIVEPHAPLAVTTHDHDDAHEHGHHHDHGHHDHDHDHAVVPDDDSATPAVAEKHEHEHHGLAVIAVLLVGFFTLFGLDLTLLSLGRNDTEGVKPLGYLVLFSDAMENFLDGLVIGAAFLVSVPVGMAATLAILLHEVPMELGDFAVLTHSGFTKRKALLFNFLSGCVNLVGVAIAVTLGTVLEGFSAIATPFAAGAILYLAATGLLPQIRLHGNGAQKAAYFAMTLLGVALMALILLLE